MRIGHRLTIGFGVILLLMSGMILFITMSLNRADRVQKLVVIHTHDLKTCDELKEYIQRWLISIEYILKKKDTSNLDYHEIMEVSIENKLKGISCNIYDKEAVALFKRTWQFFNNIKTLDDDATTRLKSGNNVTTIERDNWNNKFEADALEFTKTFYNLHEKITTSYNLAISYGEKVLRRCWFAIYVITPLTIVISGVFGYFITRGVTRPLNLLNTSIKRIASGSYDIKISPNFSAEINEVFNVFNDMSLKLDEANKRLVQLSIKDELTGMYNRRYFDETLEREVLRSKRLRHPLCLLFIDIDKFKHFNDAYGHVEGDKVLQCLGKLIIEQVRNGIDIPCRYGGEEFTIILPETRRISAVTVANRIFQNFRGAKFHIATKDEPVQKTISVGVAEIEYKDDAKTFLVHADKAMYEAKKLGGNRVCEYRA